MPKAGERRPFEYSYLGPYSSRPGVSRSFCGASQAAAMVARAVIRLGHDPTTHQVILTEHETGRRWTVDGDGNTTELANV